MNPYEPTDAASGEDHDGVEVMTLQKVGVLSAFKVLSVLYGAIAAVFSVLYGVGIALVSILAAANGEGAALMGLVAAVAVVFIVPLVYGAIGGAFGALMAFVYNVVAGRFGGLELSFGSGSS